MALRRAVFLDKDGTLVVNEPYNVDPARLRLAPGAREGLRALSAAGYLLLVISNQSGVARGYFPEASLRVVEHWLDAGFCEAGATLSGFYFCPHHPAGSVAEYAIDCSCRKPAPGLILRAAVDHGIELAHSWFVGDILDAVEAGSRAGCRTVLIDNGNETEWRLGGCRNPSYTAPDLIEAARAILSAPGVPR
jgi:D-glycero-D-manno-heptose 1,7-bisphosphate phosphatase